MAVCSRCAAPLPRAYQLKNCVPCRRHLIVIKRVLRQERREAGICLRCIRPNDRPGGSYCAACCLVLGVLNRRTREARRLAGSCGTCSAPPIPGTKNCERCTLMRRASQRKRAAQLRDARLAVADAIAARLRAAHAAV